MDNQDYEKHVNDLVNIVALANSNIKPSTYSIYDIVRINGVFSVKERGMIYNDST